MKTCECRNCGHVFTVRKPMPFCTAACRFEYNKQQTDNNKTLTIQVGVNNDQSNIPEATK